MDHVLSVSRLLDLLQEEVESNFCQLAVEGEISNFSQPASGHCYFTLKDSQAQLRAVMFRSQVRRLKFRPADGMQVCCRGRLSVYRQRGEVQLMVEALTPLGIGELQVAYQQLRQSLEAEGLFSHERKQPLPAFPRTVGLVTSATGAAVRDMLNVLSRRSGGLRVQVCPVRVQGEGAAAEIAAAIASFNQLGEAEVLLVGRGGGSLEDLWAFNEETVARAIAGSRIPIIAAVGHETDFTIADAVADLRAPTPSAAAELVVKNRLDLETHLDHLVQRLVHQCQGRLALLRERVAGLLNRLQPPQQRLGLARRRLHQADQRLVAAAERRLEQERSRLTTLAGRLEALSPLKVLARGYSIVFNSSGQPVHDSTELQVGEQIDLQFARGKAHGRIEGIE